MAEGVTTTDDKKLNGNHSQHPPEYPGPTAMDASSAPEADTSQTEVPNVEVRNQSLYQQTSPMTAEQLQDHSDKFKREEAKKYFSLREGQFETAVNSELCNEIIKPEEDGKVLSSYLLTEIDHWDHEKERIVIITEKKLVLIKYNFIGLRVDDHRKIPLINCDKIQSGRFTYPKNTMMIPRHFQTGLRVYMNKNTQPSFLQNWNPWSKEIPFITFAWHKATLLTEDIPSYLDLNRCQQDLVSAVTAAHNELHPGVAEDSLEFSNDPILIQVYCGASPIVHNWSILGFNRDRGSFGY